MRPEIIHFQGAQRPVTYLVIWLALRLLSSARFVYTPQDILPFSECSHSIVALRLFYRRMSHVFLNARQNLEVATRLFGIAPTDITVLPIPELRERVATFPVHPDTQLGVVLFAMQQTHNE